MDDQRSVEILTGLVNECRSAWLDMAASWTAVDDDAGAVLPALGSWTQHIIYAAEAVGVLFANGYGHAAHPLLRQILEHSVATAIVAKNPARYEDYFRHPWAGLGRVQEARAAAGLDQYPDVAEFLAAAEEPTSQHTGSKTRFASLGDDGQRLYASWLDETQQVAADRLIAAADSPERTLAAVRSTSRGAADVELLSARVGVRPMPADGEPIVGPVAAVPGLYVAVLHSAVTLAPAVGRLVARKLVDGAVAPELAGCSLDRF
ncbi:FAD-binding oxidoreductase [Jiangella aurantiaca]|uniref:FAD-binding oxidoreductase n=1 Tax=Jiangella aurantiaca TaxID=2530373 RepID=A0A4R5AIG0_9ACTN|nr:FAD-dependent oxidoreductase [Jiangella aurantiaca]TDD71236.1 FAD-binding oxidoreductase [Jiangella aurantiaca]